MRTLKKTLSLVLVVAMVLGLCVVGASAYNKVEDFTDDVSKIGDAYYEAVGVLTGIGVIDGMTETAFEPQGNYTREQAAKIIAYMQLGKDKADSLKCTVAPFEDVAATRWSAGYIAYCVEQGIIDGMTETTFEPTGKLTGFQWAKMLLCAVGFGVNGEFTGSSWSVNTAKVAHTVDLFAGDLAGADHVALTREQAALYAFNVLTNVKKVAYSANVTSYVYGIRGYWTVDGIGHTLATDVYKLYNATGIVVDNEALGAPATVINVKGGYDTTAANLVSVKADTGLNMMYHAARVWYVAGTKANTGVFVLDLAKTETTNCPTSLPNANVKNIGKEVANSVPYQYDKVDNSAIDAGTVNVVMYYKLSQLGARVAVKNTTVIDTTTVDNAYIKTDISAIDKGATIIYLKGESTTTDKAGWHVYAATATSGAVKSLSSKGVITLTDGTVLAPSNLEGAGRAEALVRIETILSAIWHETPTYYFTLDTHGHYITMTENPYRTVALYTGSWKLSSSHDAWSTSVQYAAQFVDVKTGEIKVVPVRNTWIENNWQLEDKGYFDITDELFGDATYAPHPVDVSDNYYGGSYAIVNSVDGTGVSSYTFSANDTANRIGVAVPTKNGYTVDGVRFNDETVTFIIVNGTGDTLSVDTYTGVDELVAGYAKKTGMPITSVTLSNMALVVAETKAGNMSASVIFAYDAALATGGVVFFPTDVEKWSVVSDDYYSYQLAYLNGEKETSEIKVARGATVDGVTVNATGADIERGFYFYTLNELNYCVSLKRVPIQGRAVFYSDNKVDMTSDGKYWINDIEVSSECKVVDTRSGAGVTVDTIDELAKLVDNNYYTGAIQVFYLKTSDKIDLIYVVDYNLGWIEVTAPTGWTVDGKASVETYEDDSVVLTSNGLKALDDGTVVDIAFTVDPTAAAATATVEATVKDGKVTVPVHDFVKNGTKLADVTITGVTYDVTVTNAQTEFVLWYKNPTTATKVDGNTVTLTVKVGDTIALGFHRDTVKAGIVATVAMTGTDDQQVTWNANGDVWTTAFVPETNAVTVDSITAKFTFSLGANDGVAATNFNFENASSDANGDKVEFTAVPGDVVTFKVQRANITITTTNEGKLLVLSTSASGPQESVEAAKAAESSNQVFTFKFVPGANNERVTNATWSAETYAERIPA